MLSIREMCSAEITDDVSKSPFESCSPAINNQAGYNVEFTWKIQSSTRTRFTLEEKLDFLTTDG
jgi:hypothetical protein